MFNSNRLRLARKRRRLTGVELATKARLTAVTLSRLERTKNGPTAETVEALAKALRYPVEFFQGSDLDEVQEDSASFRSLKSMTARERDAALAAASLAFLVADYVDAEFQLPSPDLLNLSSERDPESAARRLRSAWGLGEQPVRNMIDLLEAKGVRVFSLAENTLTVDAFSCWRNNVPYIFLNTYKSAEHSRFDAAHELGHLCLHRHGGARQVAFESQANAFASSFLMPEADLRSRILQIHSLTQVRAVKARWGVSLSAMTYRLAKLGILSEWQARRCFIEINRRGFRTEEPDPLPREKSHIWQTVFRELWKRRISKEAIARKLTIPPDELESLVFGLTGETVDARALAEDSGQSRPKLAIVKT
jgi:Zn-dependent peptidase ImmA (M78 family)/DNA-binding XRE family transcriptional regulator